MAKGKILDQHNSGFLPWLIVNVANPALILSGGIGTSMDRRELFKVALVAAGVYLLLIVVSEMAVTLLFIIWVVYRRYFLLFKYNTFTL